MSDFGRTTAFAPASSSMGAACACSLCGETSRSFGGLHTVITRDVVLAAASLFLCAILGLAGIIAIIELGAILVASGVAVVPVVVLVVGVVVPGTTECDWPQRVLHPVDAGLAA